jgi:class 3 adenylate cyclase/TolB-like protein
MVADTGGQSIAVLSDHGRKLMAVVYADMAGYSRLIGLDDAGTFERLRDLRRHVFDPALARHGGTLVNTGGDSLLVTFDSIIPAVRFAVDVQRGVPEFDGGHEPDRRVRFRIGVNVGDVIPDGVNIHGDGVNIAVRLQSICPPGGICVSRIVCDHIGDRLGFGFKELGPISLRNIARPTEAFLLELAPPARTRTLLKRPFRNVLAFGAALACAAAVIAFGIDRAAVHRPTAKSPPAEATAPPRRSIAILPFANLDGAPALAGLAQGMTEGLVTDLEQLSDALIVPQIGTVRSMDQPIDARKLGQALNVRYLLTGSLRSVGIGVRTHVAMVSSETGVTVWADQLDVERPDRPMDQEEIAGWLRNSVRRQLYKVEAARIAREPLDHLDALDLILLGRALYNDPPTEQRLTRQRTLFEHALRLDPTAARAMTGVADTIIDRVTRLGEYPGEKDLERAEDLITAAETLAPAALATLWARAYLLRVEQRWPEAEVAFERVLSVYPHFDMGVRMLAMCKIQLGQPEEAIPLLQKVIREDPREPDSQPNSIRLGQAFLLAGKYEDAIYWTQRALAANPRQTSVFQARFHMYIAAADALTGHINAAHEETLAAIALWPYLTVRSFMAENVVNETFIRQIEPVRKALRLAGLRDHVVEDADSGIAPDSRLRTDPFGVTPLTVPGAAAIRTQELGVLMRDDAPLVIDASPGNWTLAGAVSAFETGLGGSLQDNIQEELRPFMAALTGEKLSRPIVSLGQNAERWSGYNLALRLVALGYRNVYWYRGGREAWDAAGLPMGRARVLSLAAR